MFHVVDVVNCADIAVGMAVPAVAPAMVNTVAATCSAMHADAMLWLLYTFAVDCNQMAKDLKRIIPIWLVMLWTTMPLTPNLLIILAFQHQIDARLSLLLVLVRARCRK